MSRPGLTNERLTALFLLAVLLFMPPFLGIFNSTTRLLGVPVLFLYLFTTWALLIALMAVVVTRSDATAEQGVSEVADQRADAGIPPQSE